MGRGFLRVKQELANVLFGHARELAREDVLETQQPEHRLLGDWGRQTVRQHVELNHLLLLLLFCGFVPCWVSIKYLKTTCFNSQKARGVLETYIGSCHPVEIIDGADYFCYGLGADVFEVLLKFALLCVSR